MRLRSLASVETALANWRVSALDWIAIRAGDHDGASRLAKKHPGEGILDGRLHRRF